MSNAHWMLILENIDFMFRKRHFQNSDDILLGVNDVFTYFAMDEREEEVLVIFRCFALFFIHFL